VGYHSMMEPRDYENREVSDIVDRERPAKGAAFSADRNYRYHLWRLDGGGCDRAHHVMFIGLNPSTADEKTDDTTIRKCLGFARRWGWRGVHMLNLFALVATQPAKLLTVEAPICEPGVINKTDNLLGYYGQRCGRVVVCWGSMTASHRKLLQFDQRVAAVMDLLPKHVYCLGKTADGSPRHPSRLAYSTPLELFLNPSG